MRKVLYITGTRADYGLMRSTLRNIEARKDLELVVVVTGMHLMTEFGSTAREVEKDGFRAILVPARFESDSRAAAPRFLGRFLQQLTDVVEKERPDEILLLGDRAEMLAGAIVGSYMSIPTFHVHGGDVSSTVDEHVRHAITKLSHFHLAATELSAERIRRMGEEERRISVVGSPSIDGINELKKISDAELKDMGIDPSRPYLMLVQHPVSESSGKATEQISEIIDALVEDGRQTVVIYPNADSGGRQIIEVIQSRCRKPQFICFPSLSREVYLRLLSRAVALIGNTSSGLVEAPSLGTPYVSVGDRQKGRQKSDNVVEVGYGREEVLRGLRTAANAEFMRKAAERRNPYGDGHTGERIAEVLANVVLDSTINQKRLSYDI